VGDLVQLRPKELRLAKVTCCWDCPFQRPLSLRYVLYPGRQPTAVGAKRGCVAAEERELPSFDPESPAPAWCPLREIRVEVRLNEP
jgi:hypothetical protein